MRSIAGKKKNKKENINMYLGKTVFAHYILIDDIYFSSF